MYGTVGRVKIKPENREAFMKTLNEQQSVDVPGFKSAYYMFPENRAGDAVLVVFFEDKDSYWKNANDPAQDARYQEFSKYFDSEPEWHDGEWIESQ